MTRPKCFGDDECPLEEPQKMCKFASECYDAMKARHIIESHRF